MTYFNFNFDDESAPLPLSRADRAMKIEEALLRAESKLLASAAEDQAFVLGWERVQFSDFKTYTDLGIRIRRNGKAELRAVDVATMEPRKVT